MFKISMTLDANIDNGIITIEETGEILDDMNLKKDIKGEILRILSGYKSIKKCNVNLIVEKNGKYYDRDEFLIAINDDFSNLTFLY